MKRFMKLQQKEFRKTFTSTINDWRLYIETFLKWLVIASLIGGAGGLIGAIFHHSIEMAEEMRGAHPWLLWLLPIAGLLIVGFYKMTKTEGLNTNHVIRAVHKGKRLSVLLIPAIFFGTVLTQLCGGSAGREGAALQMGGTIGQWIGRGLHLDDSDLRIATLAGMARSFQRCSERPLAAAVFAVMVISIGILYHVALVPCLIASLSAYFLAGALGVQPVRFAVEVPEASALTFFQVGFLGILCALVSILFCVMMHGAESQMKKFLPNAWLRTLAGAGIVIALTYLCGTNEYNGVGMGVITAAIEEGKAEPLAFLLKLVFTSVTLAAGFKGGEIVPSFFVGAALGCVIAPLIGLPAGFGAGSRSCQRFLWGYELPDFIGIPVD